jgi:leader peptidase (prepilin peptidase)/N-methyltransferase
LRGHCRHCGEPISPRYPLIELATAVLFAATAARVGYRADLPALLVLVAGLLVLGVIDAEFLVLPKRIVYVVLGLQVITLVAASFDHDQWHRLIVALLVGAVWFVFFFTINAVSPRALGFGDVRLSLGLGLGLGWLGVEYAVLGFFVANLVGAVVGVALIAAKRIDRRQPVPYGVFLAVGAYVAIYAGPELLAPFQNLQWHL